MASKLSALKSLASRRSTYNASQARDEDGRWAAEGSRNIPGGSTTALTRQEQKPDESSPAKAKRTPRTASQAAKATTTTAEITAVDMPTGDQIKKAKLTHLGLTQTLNAPDIYSAKIGKNNFFVKGILDPDNALAETAVAAAAQHMGLGEMVLPAVATKRKLPSGDTLACVATPLLQGEDLASLGDRNAIKNMSDDEAKRCLLFDYAIGNSDRHSGNAFKSEDGKIKLIDHEACWHRFDTIDDMNMFYERFDPGAADRKPGAPAPASVRNTPIPRQVVEQIVNSEAKVVASLQEHYKGAVSSLSARNAIGGFKKRVAVLRKGLNSNNMTLGLLIDR